MEGIANRPRAIPHGLSLPPSPSEPPPEVHGEVEAGTSAEGKLARQPGPAEAPIPLHRCQRYFEDFRDLGHLLAPENFQLHDLALAQIEFLQVIEHLTNPGGIGFGRSGGRGAEVGQRHAQRATAPLGAPAGSLIIGKGVPHHLRSEGEEVTTVGERWRIRQQPQERLIDQCCRLQCDPIQSTEAMAQLSTGHLFELVVDQRDDTLEGRLVTPGCRLKQPRDLPLLVHTITMARATETG